MYDHRPLEGIVNRVTFNHGFHVSNVLTHVEMDGIKSCRIKWKGNGWDKILWHKVEGNGWIFWYQIISHKGNSNSAGCLPMCIGLDDWLTWIILFFILKGVVKKYTALVRVRTQDRSLQLILYSVNNYFNSTLDSVNNNFYSTLDSVNNNFYSTLYSVNNNFNSTLQC